MVNMVALQGIINKQKELAKQRYDLAKETQNYIDAWEADHFKRVVLALEELKELKRWTPISEGYPEEEVDVLVCNKEGNIVISRGSYSTEIKDRWVWYTSGWKFGKIIAWKSLPKPYESYNYTDGSAFLETLNRLREVTESEK